MKLDFTDGVIESDVIKTPPMPIVYKQASKYIPMDLPAHKDASATTLHINAKDMTSQIVACKEFFAKKAEDSSVHNNVLESAIKIVEDTIHLDKQEDNSLDSPKKNNPGKSVTFKS